MGTLVQTLAELTDVQTFEQLIDEAFLIILQDTPNTSWMGLGGAVDGDEDAKVVFTDETRTETTGTLDNNYATVDSLLTVVDSSVFRVGDVVLIDGHLDLNQIQLKFRVTAIPDGTTLTVGSDPINGTDTLLVSTGQSIRRTGSIPDNHIPDTFSKLQEPEKYVNFIQWMEESLDLGKKAQMTIGAGLAYSIPDGIARSIEQRLYAMQYQVYNAVMNGVGQAETTSLGATMSGLLDFIQTASLANRIDVNGALTETVLNDLMQKLVDLGLPNSAQLTFIASVKQARVISALRDAKVQYSDTGGNQNLGTNVQTYVTEIAGWANLQIVIDRNLPENLALLIAPQFIKFRPKAGMPLLQMEDATAIGQLGTRTTIRTAGTLEVQGRANFHGVLTRLT